jgi:hypothetical protein
MKPPGREAADDIDELEVDAGEVEENEAEEVAEAEEEAEAKGIVTFSSRWLARRVSRTRRGRSLSILEIYYRMHIYWLSLV